MKSNLPKVVRRYAVWLTFADGREHLSSNLFDTPQAATECIEGMPAFCRGKGDEDGAKEWETVRADVLVIDIAIPKEKGGAK